jgi:hypothetical protein
MSVNPSNPVTEKQLERARGDRDSVSRLAIEVSKEFLQWVNVESAKRGMSNRDFTIEALIQNGQEKF